MRDDDDHVSQNVPEGSLCTECGGVRNVLGVNHGNSVQARTIYGGVRFCACSHDPQKDAIALLQAETDASLNLMAGHLTLPTPDGGVEVERELFHDLVAPTLKLQPTSPPGSEKRANLRGTAGLARRPMSDRSIWRLRPFIGSRRPGFQGRGRYRARGMPARCGGGCSPANPNLSSCRARVART